jgi:hypothetical protein
MSDEPSGTQSEHVVCSVNSPAEAQLVNAVDEFRRGRLTFQIPQDTSSLDRAIFNCICVCHPEPTCTCSA